MQDYVKVYLEIKEKSKEETLHNRKALIGFMNYKVGHRIKLRYTTGDYI